MDFDFVITCVVTVRVGTGVVELAVTGDADVGALVAAAMLCGAVAVALEADVAANTDLEPRPARRPEDHVNPNLRPTATACSRLVTHSF